MTQYALNVVISRESVPGYYRIGEQNVSLNDTIKINDLVNISNSHVLSLGDGSDITHTHSGNTITITQAVTNLRVLVVAWGR